MSQVPATRAAALGNNLDYTPPSTAVTGGDVLVIGTIPMIATGDIAVGRKGALATSGLFDVPKDGSTFADGDPVYWQPTGNPNGGTAGTGAASSTASGGYLMGFVPPGCADLVGSATKIRTKLTAAKRTTTLGGAIVADSLTGDASTMPIAGLAAAQGGSVSLTGGASSTSANAGGAASVTGGAPGATGVGGAASLTGAAGGATSGNGGAASVTGGAGTNGNATGGVASVTGGAGQGSAAGGAATVTGGLAGATGVGGAATIAAGAGGATSGNGGVASLTGGAGTAGNATGGIGKVVGGAGQGSAAGGAAQLTGGAGGATGAGGAIAVTGGAGGATSGTGGAVAIAGGAGTNGNANGGAVTINGGALNGSGANGTVTIQSAYAPVAGGGTSAALLCTSTAALGIYFGTGAPTFAAAKGSLYLKTDASTSATRLYVSSDAVGTWTAFTSAA